MIGGKSTENTTFSVSFLLPSKSLVKYLTVYVPSAMLVLDAVAFRLSLASVKETLFIPSSKVYWAAVRFSLLVILKEIGGAVYVVFCGLKIVISGDAVSGSGVIQESNVMFF